MSLNNKKSEKNVFLKHVLTFLSFCALCSAVPILFVNYCVLQYFRKIWLAILSNRFPHLEFVKSHSVRSLVDSWRNPAVINVLVEIKGKCDKNLIRSAISEHLLSRSCLLDKTSPNCQHLRRQLTSCWGSSAWVNGDATDEASFDVTRHVVCASKIYRGRPVSEANIQEYVSSVTKKYLPSNQPPWQIVIIPNIVSLEEKYYVVVRIHHLLLAKEHRLNIGDFLMLKRRSKYDNVASIPQMISTSSLPENYSSSLARQNKKFQKSKMYYQDKSRSKISRKSSKEKNVAKISTLPTQSQKQDYSYEQQPESEIIIKRQFTATKDSLENTPSTSQLGAENLNLMTQGRTNPSIIVTTYEFSEQSDSINQLDSQLLENPTLNLSRRKNSYDIFDTANLEKLHLIGEKLVNAHTELTSKTSVYDANKEVLHHTVSEIDSISNPNFRKIEKSPLLDIFENPTAGPELLQRINVSLTNLWNEFKGNYDPLEWPKKGQIGLAGLTAIVLIVLSCVWKDLNKGAISPKASLAFRSWYLKASFEKEFARRNITFSSIFDAFKYTVNPINLIKFYIALWLGFTFWLCKIPLALSKEMLAAISIVRNGYCTYSDTWCSTMYEFLPLMYRVCKELCYIFSVIYNAPLDLLSELFPRNSREPKHILQTVSLCGRKVVAWSNSISTDVILEIARKTGVTTTEVMLSAACGALADYFRENGEVVPSNICATVRHVQQDFLLTPFSPHRITHRDRIGGVVCIRLPLEHTKDVDDCLKNLKAVKESLEHSRAQQKALFALSLIQTKHGLVTRALPSVLSKLCATYFSRKFAVTFTEVGSDSDDNCGISNVDEWSESKDDVIRNPMETKWGHEVTGVMYWRPPQANISVSITFQAYGSSMRMGVMADGQLSPYHSQMTESWHRRISQLAGKASVNCDVVLRVPTISPQSSQDEIGYI